MSKRYTCRGKITAVLENLRRSWAWSESFNNLKTRLHPPLSDPAELDKVTDSHKLLCQSPQKPLPVGGIASAYTQKLRRAGQKSDISRSFTTDFSWSQNPTIDGDQY